MNEKEFNIDLIANIWKQTKKEGKSSRIIPYHRGSYEMYGIAIWN